MAEKLQLASIIIINFEMFLAAMLSRTRYSQRLLSHIRLGVAVTLPPAYLSCEFAFHVRFQRIVRALSLNCV